MKGIINWKAAGFSEPAINLSLDLTPTLICYRKALLTGEVKVTCGNKER